MSFLFVALAGLVAWGHFEMVGRVVYGPFTVWIAWFWSTVLITGAAIAIELHRTGERGPFRAWAVIVVTMLVPYSAYAFASDPVTVLGVKNAVLAVTLALLAPFDRRVLAAAGFHAVMIFLGMADWLGWLTPRAARPPVFLALTYGDLSTACQHLALLALTVRPLHAALEDDPVGGVGGHRAGGAGAGLAPVARVPGQE